VFSVDGDRVVLSGGAIATPGILLRSGVGPKDELARLGIAPVAHVPGVGARLLDHPGVAIFFMPHRRGFASVDDPIIQNVYRYRAAGSDCPNDMQIQPGSFLPLPFRHLPGVTLAVCLGKPRGEGRLRFPSARPNVAPIIETRLLADPQDASRAREALRTVHRLSRTKAIQAVARPVYPPSAFDEHGELRAPLAQITGSGYHPCGTVPMGPDSDPNAAVSARGKVRGTTGLWVADASLMPTIPSCNTNLPSLMIGERFGEWLREDV
jgi:choline dehydrogenase